MEWFRKKSEPLWIKDSEGRKYLSDEGICQFYQLESEGKARQVCEVHIIDPATEDPRVETWTVTPYPVSKYGHIDRETYNRLRDGDGQIFTIFHYVQGQRQSHLVAKFAWLQILDAVKI